LELLHQNLEAHFAGAVAGCDPLDLELVIKLRCRPLPVWPRRYGEMKAAGDGVELPIDRSGGLEDFLDAWMRASDHDGQSLRRLDRQRHLVHVARSRLLGHARQYSEA